MLCIRKLILFFIVLLPLSLSIPCVFAQGNGSYGNEWIKYNQAYVRISVEKEGIHRILLSSLPSDFFKSDPSKLQLWRRGKEVPILVANETEIQFYGVINDGASDSLMFRPAAARLNSNVSLFSDQGYYFLTNSVDAKRIKIVDGTLLTGTSDTFHFKTDIVKFSNQFANSTFNEATSINNSYYDWGNSWTSTTIAGPKATYPSVTATEITASFQLKNWVNNGVNPSLELLVNGLQEGAHDIQILTGKTLLDTDLRKVANLPFTGWGGAKALVELKSSDFNVSGSGNIKLTSTSTSNLDWYGLSYYKITYPQLSDMQGEIMSFFNFPAISSLLSRISILNTPEDATIYDVSNPENIVQVKGIRVGSILDAMIGRANGQPLRLLVTSSSAIMTVENKNISKVNFQPIFSFPLVATSSIAINPSSYDYLVVSNNTLQNAAIKYAEYRSSAKGGAYRTLVMNIRDIYDQFNYGEPSPVAIRRFINYMLKDGIREDKHNLLLIGHSVSYPIRVVKEMPDEVPTFGDPGSDMLLVAGLQKTNSDVAAIPVGRINAFTETEVLSYLAKVSDYEHEADVSWRKNVLHLNGGHSAGEINQLKGILSNLVPVVETGELGGRVYPFVKSSGSEVEKVNIAPEVNKGVGMITYFGHGSQTITDLDMGYITDASRGYQNSRKYPLMYFNGCGVGNIFTSRTTQVLSGNWLLTPSKGAIAIIANSYKSYVSSSSHHLEILYNSLFTNKNNYTIGQVMKDVSKTVISQSPGIYEIANIHQSNLLGDPALHVIRIDKPDYGLDNEDAIFIYSEDSNHTIENSNNITVSLTVSNGGKYSKSEELDVLLNFFYKDNTKFVKEITVPSVAYRDTLSFSVPNRKDLVRVEAYLDPHNKISELSKNNNYTELLVDWGLAKDKTFYPTEQIKDIIPPLLTVKFDNKYLKNDEVVSPNPLIQLVLSDDRVLSIDTTLLDIFLKNCGDDKCEYKRIAYSSNQIELNIYSNRILQVSYQSNLLAPGIYELMVNSKDRAGNVSLRQYQIRFIIDDDATKLPLSVVVSPNPASNYVRFEVSSNDLSSLDKINWAIFDINGVLREEKTISPKQLINNEWYWLPTVPTGLYIYKIIFTTHSDETKVISGKIAVVK